MSKTFFTSDTHFGHKGILKHCNRPFETIEEHDQALIKNWNAVVDPKDVVYHLGDISFLSYNKTKEILKQLNGKIFLIKGNHDSNRYLERLFVDGLIEDWCDYLEIEIQSQKIVLCHFPLAVWNNAHHGAWHLHGHCHGTLREHRPLRFDVGVDNTADLIPLAFDFLKLWMAAEEYKPLDHHGAKNQNSQDSPDEVREMVKKVPHKNQTASQAVITADFCDVCDAYHVRLDHRIVKSFRTKWGAK